MAQISCVQYHSHADNSSLCEFIILDVLSLCLCDTILYKSILWSIVILYYVLTVELIVEKYKEIHRSQDGLGIKTLDFYVKKKTDHYNNLINT